MSTTIRLSKKSLSLFRDTSIDLQSDLRKKLTDEEAVLELIKFYKENKASCDVPNSSKGAEKQ